MVKASGQIEQELALLQQRTEEMSSALEPLYEGYLKALSEAGKRQLIMAAYHLCTQAYPDKFLALSWDQRNRVQQSLQTLVGQLYDQLKSRREQSKKMSRRPQQQQGLVFLQRLLAAKAAGGEIFSRESASQPDIPEDIDPAAGDQRRDSDQYAILTEDDLVDIADSPDSDFQDSEFGIEAYDEANGFDSAGFESINFDDDEELDDPEDDDSLDFEMEVPAADQRLTVAEEKDLLAALEGLARRSRQSQAEEAAAEVNQPLSPIHLMKQQMLLEKAIREVFRTVSEAANELLQKADIMPHFPQALLAAAADSHGIGEPANAVPNVVKMSVRVMQGEALSEEDEEMPEGPPGRSHQPERSDRRSGRGPSASRRSRRIVAREAMQIEALPELAAISLRLSEVEFTDPAVSAWRGRLRHKLIELKKLDRRYRKAQKALETAQAEDAWRSSWTVQEGGDEERGR